jgi:hypothetical protein
MGMYIMIGVRPDFNCFRVVLGKLLVLVESVYPLLYHQMT